jgi:uncharacterized membrane protein
VAASVSGLLALVWVLSGNWIQAAVCVVIAIGFVASIKHIKRESSAAPTATEPTN